MFSRHFTLYVLHALVISMSQIRQKKECKQMQKHTELLQELFFFFFLLQVQRSTAEEVTHLQVELKANITCYHQHSFRQW